MNSVVARDGAKSMKLETEQRHLKTLPFALPSCFQWPNSSFADKLLDVHPIRLYKGLYSQKAFLVCTICHPVNIKNLATSIHDHYKRIAVKLSQTPESVKRLPRTPQLFVPNSRFQDNLYEVNSLTDDYFKALDQYIIELKSAFDQVSPIRCFNISEFYSNTYTHALSWSFVSKIEQQNKMMENFEQHIRYLKGNESYGLACGPMITHDLAEMFLLLMDIDIQNALKQEWDTIKIVRILDTYLIVHEDSVDMETVKESIEDVLMEYNLLLNPRKETAFNFDDIQLFTIDHKWHEIEITTQFDLPLIVMKCFSYFRQTYSNHIDKFIVLLLKSIDCLPLISEFMVLDYCSPYSSDDLCISIRCFALLLFRNLSKFSRQSIQYCNLAYLAIVLRLNENETKGICVPSKPSYPGAILSTLWQHFQKGHALDIDIQLTLNQHGLFSNAALVRDIVLAMDLKNCVIIGLFGYTNNSDKVGIKEWFNEQTGAQIRYFDCSTYDNARSSANKELEDGGKCDIVVIEMDELKDPPEYWIGVKNNNRMFYSWFKEFSHVGTSTKFKDTKKEWGKVCTLKVN